MKLILRTIHYAFFLLMTGLLYSQNVIPGLLRSYTTLHSIGIEWDVLGDDNHNSTCSVEFRETGSKSWQNSMSLFRIDFQGYYQEQTADRHYNMLAGSIMYLDPGTEYEVYLKIQDPEGGDIDTVIIIKTKDLPALSSSGRTFYVIPGDGGGDGSISNPFRGLSSAQSSAKPGDIYFLEKGYYGGFNFTKSGTEDAYIIWKASEDGVNLDFAGLSGHHIWLDGMKFSYNINSEHPWGVGALGASSSIAITQCKFTDYHSFGIYVSERGADGWYIADNTIVGDKSNPNIMDNTGEGIMIFNTYDHTICYNSITKTADGISCIGSRNCDVFGNEVFNVSDDGIESDNSYANIRIWENRITNPKAAGFSFQPMYCGPWYFIRNQVMGVSCEILKLRVVDRFFIAHNTFIGQITNLAFHAQNILAAYSRNNLWIQDNKNSRIWVGNPCSYSNNRCTEPEHFFPDWQTDVDFDGFDWGNSREPFLWGPDFTLFRDLVSFSEAIGIESNGVQVDKLDLFPDLNFNDIDTFYKIAYLTLRPGCGAIDKGAILDNINQNFTGNAPDLGAYELNKPLPQYGPRDDGDIDGYIDEDFFAFPNPFSNTIRLRVITRKEVNWSVHDCNGKIVDTFSGHDILWNADGFPTGVYIIKALVGDHQMSKQVISIE